MGRRCHCGRPTRTWILNTRRHRNRSAKNMCARSGRACGFFSTWCSRCSRCSARTRFIWAAITFLEWWRGLTYQNYFYMVMFGAHLVLGLLIVLPVIIFGCIHIKNAHDRPNRRAVRVGYALFAIALVLSGVRHCADAVRLLLDQRPARALADLLGARHHAVARDLALRSASAGRAAHQVASSA